MGLKRSITPFSLLLGALLIKLSGYLITKSVLQSIQSATYGGGLSVRAVAIDRIAMMENIDGIFNFLSLSVGIVGIILLIRQKKSKDG